MHNTMPHPPTGPYETEYEARAAAHRVVSPEPGWSILRADGNRELLHRALDEAGVELGAYDERVAAWVASWEDCSVAVVAGWIARAHAAEEAAGALRGDLFSAVRQALAEAVAAREERAAAPCEGCDASPAGVCDSHAADLDAAEAFRAAERELAGGRR